jgi:uncharacterized protein
VTARFTSFLVKIASRCNLDCDYCYMYQHADQSWKGMPKVLSTDDRAAFAARLATYLQEASVQRCLVIFHGGEPLLAGWKSIVAFSRQIGEASPGREIEFGIQTNGLLLTEEAVQAFEDAGIGISLSLDGPRRANDLHRLTKRGRSSFDQTARALTVLQRHPAAFSGVIAVIDPAVAPREVLEFFSEVNPPRLDLLLPDGNHLRQPPSRLVNPALYEDWLIEAFDLWFDEFSPLEVRTFEALLDALAGLDSGTDAFGLGDVSLLTIETDGSYHDLDVLKITQQGATRLQGSVRDTEIAAVAQSPSLARHRRLLRKEGLSAKCRECPEMVICGGGAVPHRFGPNEFDHPTVYCREMLALIAHARRRVAAALLPAPRPQRVAEEIDFPAFERAESAGRIMERLQTDAAAHHGAQLQQTIDSLGFGTTRPALSPSINRVDMEHLASRPGMVAWNKSMRMVLARGRSYSIDGKELRPEAAYLTDAWSRSRARRLEIGSDDPWLRFPFGDAILFEDALVAESARPLIEDALAIIERWRPALAAEIRSACTDIQLVRDPKAHPDKIVSFSDDSVPGALFVSVRQGPRMVSPIDLADSIIHEHRHQKLYLLERNVQLFQANNQRVVSPWREDPRPPSGLLHAVFVFVELRRFWTHILATGAANDAARARNQVDENATRLAAAFQTLDQCPLTPLGRALVKTLEAACDLAPAMA